VIQFFSFLKGLPKRDKLPLLIIDEFDAFVEVEKSVPGTIDCLDLIVQHLRIHPGETLHSIVYAGNFSIHASPEDVLCEYTEPECLETNEQSYYEYRTKISTEIILTQPITLEFIIGVQETLDFAIGFFPTLLPLAYIISPVIFSNFGLTRD
jgi:hypothetical protein